MFERESPVLHQHPPADDRRVHGGLRKAEHDVAEGVRAPERRRRVVVENRHIARAAFAKFAEAEAEDPPGNRGVVREQGARNFRKSDRRVFVREMLAPQRHAQLFEHVRGHGIRAEADEDAPPAHRDDVRDADGVVHVRLGIVHHRRPRLRQQIHFPAIDVDAMRRDRVVAENPAPLQPFDHPQARGAPRRILVALRLGDVNVKAGVQLVAETPGLLQRRVRQRERGMQAEERLDAIIVPLAATADEGRVLRQTFLGDAGAVAIRDLVAEAGAQTGFAHRPLDGGQRAGDRPRAGVMIDDGRGAVPDRVEEGDQRAIVAVLRGQGRIQPPPEILQHPREILRRFDPGQPAGKRAVAVRMRVDQTRQHDLARGVDALARKAAEPARRRDPRDEPVFNQDRMTAQDARGSSG